MNDRRLTTRGFTLIEVLAALMLVAIVLPLLLRGFGGSTDATAASQDQTRALTLAEAILSESVAERTWETGDAEGAFDPARFGSGADRFSWRIESEDWTAAETKQLTAAVTWTRRGRERSVELVTVVAEQEF
ncbi:MAG: type II secretion system protein [Planctomycetota bacterium]